ncbi:hypothetical protein B0H19DRAFT_1267565 [Mycena capillaripes]|nr:hypothetical protein B0H19DRAFT_1267565 [Mycena capillaripes]
MRFSEDQYYALEAQIKQRICWYLDARRGFEEQDPKQVDALVKEIRCDHPILNRYEDSWPVTVILKRLLRDSGQYDDASDRETTIECSLGVESQSQRHGYAELFPPFQTRPTLEHRCPRLSNYYDYDGPRSVSPTAKTLLSFLNMAEELSPALYLLGVRDDERFAAVRKMTLERKIQLLEETKEIQPTLLQLWVMYKIFQK